jgi:hypothetical protein
MESGTFIKFYSSKEHYTADACVFWCFDARFADLYNEFLSQRGFAHAKIDAVKGAGGAQPLAGEAGPEKLIAESQIAKSIKLHHTERVILMVHMDCGGYGGSKAFGDMRELEWDHHVAELTKATDYVHAQFPDIKEVECWIADFDGIRKI